jgi:hypothetical protein
LYAPYQPARIRGISKTALKTANCLLFAGDVHWYCLNLAAPYQGFETAVKALFGLNVVAYIIFWFMYMGGRKLRFLTKNIDTSI